MDGFDAAAGQRKDRLKVLRQSRAAADVDADETTYTFWNPLPAFPAVKDDPGSSGG